MAATGRAVRTPAVRKGDTVIVLSGKDAGKRGTVERVLTSPRPVMRGWGVKPDPARETRGAYVVVEGINIARRHTKPRPVSSSTDQASQMQRGGIIEIPQPVPVGKVMVVCPRCDQPTRVGHAKGGDGRSVRVCRHCAEPLEAKA
jgi:large subunit ribosomal protein L24